MPYSIILIINKKTTESGFIFNDNNKSTFGLEDRKIKRKCDIIVKKLKKFKDVEDAFVKYTPVAQMEEQCHTKS